MGAQQQNLSGRSMINDILKIVLNKRIREFQVYLRQQDFKGVMLNRDQVQNFIQLYEEAVKVLEKK